MSEATEASETAKATAGPWRNLDNQDHPDLAGYVVIGGDGIMVGDFNIFGCGESRPDETCRANANIASAAPDLLAACKLLEEACDSLMSEITGKGVAKWGIVNKALCDGVKAVAKAEGRAS